MDNLQRSSDLLNLLEADQCGADTTVEAYYSLLDDSGKREPVEEIVDLIEHRVVISRVLSKSIAALLSESEGVVDPLVLMVSSQQMDLVWESDLECHQKADGLQRVVTSINIVTQEEIVVVFDISVLIWCSPKIEESHQILILAMDISEYLHWGVYLQDHWLRLEDFQCLISKRDDVLSSKGEVSLTVDGC